MRAVMINFSPAREVNLTRFDGHPDHARCYARA